MSSRFVDRDAEISRLREAVRHPPELVIVRGRRRVGKSALIDRALSATRTIFFQADEQPAPAQLELFGQELGRMLPGTPPVHFRDWDEALRYVGELATEQPLALVLDEFQWLWQSDPHLDSKLQRHWDRWERARTPITVILSGSALAMMERLLDHSSPLYGRAQYRPLLLPLDYRFAAQFASARASVEERLLRYAVLGGTPQYQVWAGDSPLRTVIAAKILTKDEALFEEPLHLLRAEQQMRDPGTYFAVVAAIAQGNTRPSEIANRTGLQVPNLMKMLGRLIELDYVELREPLMPVKESKRGRYRLKDPFFRFWFRFVFPNRSRLARGRVGEVGAEIDRDLPAFAGPAFEDCCREWAGRYAPADLVRGADELGSWWSRDGQAEVDVVGVADGRYSLLGSCKWNAAAPASVLSRLLAHQEILGGKAAKAQLVIFARGFSADLMRQAKDLEVTLITAKELFA